MNRLDLRLRAAVLAGRLTMAASRGLHLGGGTTLPGDVARALDPAILRKLAKAPARGVVLVTGTNGKTTTAALLRSIAAAAGWRVAGNTGGSNLIFGLTAAALANSDRAGHMGLDWLVLEVDELSCPIAVRELQPRLLVVLNAFRDQLDRSFEVDQIVARLRDAVDAMPAAGAVVLNADDPRVAALGERHPATLFGIEDPHLDRGKLPESADRPTCPRCRTPLVYAAVYYGQCGRYRCPTCDWARPDPAVRATSVREIGLDAVEVGLEDGAGLNLTASVRLTGAYNAANVAAAVTAALAMGAEEGQLARGLEQFQPAFGRSQVTTWRGAGVRLLLAKNPAGMEANLETVLALDRSPVLAVALNDGIADGRDISWIWDVELERLATGGPTKVVASGRRAAELALRLNYAGVSRDRILVCSSPEAALDAVAQLAEPGVPAPALLTYTAMLAWHRALVGSGAARPFWEGS